MTKRKKPTRKPASKPVAKPRPRDARSQSEIFADDAEDTDSLCITSSIDDHPDRPDKTERKGKASANPTTPRANVSNGDEQEADESTAPVFAELDLLEAALSGSQLDSGARSRLVKRLQEMQWKLDAEPGASTGPEADDLTASTDDEMFDLIDKELGLS
ncbi:MAG: hypothetical protein Q9177_003645 [Variospora cf. flavescens]